MAKLGKVYTEDNLSELVRMARRWKGVRLLISLKDGNSTIVRYGRRTVGKMLGDLKGIGSIGFRAMEV